MIEILVKIDQQCMIVTSKKEIYYYDQPVHKVMDLYLKPLLLSYQSLQVSSKKILGGNAYKRPISYYTNNGLNVLLPLHSSRDRTCIWVSYHFCMNNDRDTFNQLANQTITQFQWDRLLSKAISYKNMFDLNANVPTFGKKVDLEQFHTLIKTK